MSTFKQDLDHVIISQQYNGSLERFHHAVNITALTFGHIDLIACCLVIYSAYTRWRTSSLSMSSRVPLYLSISDICQYIIFMPNFFYSLIHHESVAGLSCKVLAYLLFFQINVNMILMASIAIVTYLRVVRGKTLNLGKFDWKFFACVFASSLLFSIPSIPSLGPTKFWCLTPSHSSNTLNTLLITGYTVFILTFVVTCYCYFKTLSTIFNVDSEERTNSVERIDRRNKLERQAIIKILVYILAFVKWIPLLLYGISIMSGFDEALWMHLSAVIAFNMGGIYNCVLYLMNEGFLRSNNHSTTYILENQRHQLNRSFQQHHQQTKSITISTLQHPKFLDSSEESADIIDLRTLDDDSNDGLNGGNVYDVVDKSDEDYGEYGKNMRR